MAMNTAPSTLPHPAPRLTLNDFWREIRPRQWTKNLVIFAALFFALGDRQQHITLAQFWPAGLAFLLFSVTASGIYIFNDILDLQQDRTHPVKAQRPIAAGRIGIPQAWSLAAIMLGIGLVGAGFFSCRFGLVIGAYILLQAAYTLWLKRIAFVDVFVIAAGFVLRVIAGGIVVNATISAWLLICTFLMALFLALCKRRHEKRLMIETQNTQFRPSLATGTERLLDLLIAIVAGAAIIAYTAYTQWPDTVLKFQTHRLGLTIPFVVFGILRYLYLVYRKAKGDQPEYILLTDIPLMIDIALFGVSALLIILV